MRVAHGRMKPDVWVYTGGWVYPWVGVPYATHRHVKLKDALASAPQRGCFKAPYNVTNVSRPEPSDPPTALPMKHPIKWRNKASINHGQFLGTRASFGCWRPSSATYHRPSCLPPRVLGSPQWGGGPTNGSGSLSIARSSIVLALLQQYYTGLRVEHFCAESS